ncbi:MAG: glycosyltransferase [Myxococcales bacterium]|nr:glycosyltransferase [Myxococcales bacterium]
MGHASTPRTEETVHVAYIYTRRIPLEDADTQQVLSTVDALAGRGLAVDLIVPWGLTAMLRGRADFEAAVRSFYGVEQGFVIRPLYTVEPSRFEAERPAHGLLASLLLARRYDLVHTRSRATVLLCAQLGIPVVFESYRLLHRDHPLLARLLSAVASRPAFMGVITHSEQAAASIRQAGIPASKVEVVHNGYDPRKFEPRLDQAEARRALGLAVEGKRVVYTGNVNPDKGIGCILDLAAARPEVGFSIVGGKRDELSALQEDVRARGLTNVSCPGFVQAAALTPYLYAADILIIPPTAGPLQVSGRTVLPLKVFSYLAAGRAILAPSTPDVQEVLVDGENARLVTPDDPQAALAGLDGLLGDQALCARLGAGALETAAALTWSARAERIEGLYRRWMP